MSPSRQAFSTLEPAVPLAAGGSPDRPTLVIAATSARLLAEAARASGFEVIAIDVFGDVDTRAAARTWMPLGIPGRLAPEEGRLVAALRQCATPPRPVGWIAGSGFESAPGLLATGAGVLPLLGNLPGTVARVRDPGDFFAALHRLGIPAPEISLAPPADPAGWLFKDAHACGGWHIRPAGRAPAGRGPGAYFQREEAGTAMSALFLANGASALIVGFARQIVAPLGRRPYVYRGCVGPVTLPPPHAGQVANAVSALTRHYGLRGLNGIDFLFGADGIRVLELNPRPTASLALFNDVLAGGLLAAHVDACLHGHLPAADALSPSTRVRGSEVVFAPRRGRVTPALADWLAAQADCHDLPAAGTPVARHDPVCSITCEGSAPEEVRARLSARCEAILSQLNRAAPT